MSTSGRDSCRASSAGSVRWHGRQYAAKKSTTSTRSRAPAVSKIGPCTVGRRNAGASWPSSGLGAEGGGGAGAWAHAASSVAAAPRTNEPLMRRSSDGNARAA